MKTFNIICLTLLYFSLSAQELSWYQHYDSDLRQSMKSSHVFSSGEYLLNITSYGDYYPDLNDNNLVLQNQGSFSAILARYNAEGDHQWSFVLGNEGRTEIQDFAVDQQGNIVIIGYFNGTSAIDMDPGEGELLLQGGNAEHAFLAKYDEGGQLLWAKAMYDRSATNHFLDVDDSGIIYVLSRFSGMASTYGGTVLDAGSSTSNAFLGKYDQDGDEAWVYHIKSSARINPASLQVEGNAIIVNTSFDTDITFGNNDYSLSQELGLNSVIARFDAQGNNNSNIHFGANGNLYFSRLFPFGNEFITAGRYSGLVTFPGYGDIEAVDGQDGFFARMDINGNIKWLISVNGEGNDFTRMLDVTSDGNIHAGIFFEKTMNFDGQDYSSSAKYDYLMVSMNENGEVMSTQQITGPESEQISARKTLEDGSQYIIGAFKGSFDADILNDDNELEMTCDDDADIFVVKYEANTSPVITPSLHDLSIYPNPSNGEIFLDNESGEKIQRLAIYDTYGRLIESYQQLNGSGKISLPSTPGLYFVKADQNVYRIVRR